MHTAQRNKNIYPTTRLSTVLTNSDSVSEYFAFPWRLTESSRGHKLFFFVSRESRAVVLLLRVHKRGGDVNWQYDVCMKTVVTFLFEGFTSMLSFVGMSLPVVFAVSNILGDVYADYASRVCQRS